MNNLYAYIGVWKRFNESKIAHYQCFQNIVTKRYCVQSVDFYYNPIKQKNIKEFNNQFMELFFEEQPDTRSYSYETLEEAIINYEKDFFEDGD